MNKLLALALASITLGVSLVYAIGPQSAEEGFCILHIPVLTAGAAVQVAPATQAATSCSQPHRIKSICFFNEDAVALQLSFIAPINTTDDNEGWPIFGSQDRCYDVTAGFTAWAYRGTGQPNAGFKVLYLK